jgi:hypothetical protein
MRMYYIIRALCPRATDTNDEWQPAAVCAPSSRSLVPLFLLPFVIPRYPGSFPSHGGDRIPSASLFLPVLNSIRKTSQALLDFSREFDITLLDNVVTTLYSGSGGKEVSHHISVLRQL